jgi:hypothetical protein
MSITFTSDATAETITVKTEACLCAQGAESWTTDLTGASSEVLADLRAHADPACYLCKGTGVETREDSDKPYVNWANGNAYRMLEVLGLLVDDWGEIPLAAARRAVIRATSRSDVSAFARTEERFYGKPRLAEDGTVELRPLRVFAKGLLVDDIQERITQFAEFVQESEKRGATKISWY